MKMHGRWLAVAMLVSSAAMPALAASWRQVGYGADQKRFNPVETTLGVANVANLKQLWSVASIDPYSAQSSSPVVVDGLVYVGTVYNRKLLALHASDGSAHWNRKLDGPIYGAATVVSGVAYAAGYGTQLYAFNARTGAPIWETNTGGTIANGSPAYANGRVFIGGFDGQVKAYDAASGALAWSTPTGSAIHASPAVVSGILYIGTDQLYAMSASDGLVLWTASCGGNGCEWSSPAVANGVVYLGAGDGKVYAYDASTGAPKWNVATQRFIDSSPAVANGTVYIGSGDHHLYSLRASDGRVRWIAETGDWVSSSPAVANGVVYVGSQDAGLYAFNAGSGALLWSVTTDGPIRSSPAVVDGRLYVTSGGGNIYAFGLPP